MLGQHKKAMKEEKIGEDIEAMNKKEAAEQEEVIFFSIQEL